MSKPRGAASIRALPSRAGARVRAMLHTCSINWRWKTMRRTASTSDARSTAPTTCTTAFASDVAKATTKSIDLAYCSRRIRSTTRSAILAST